MRRIQIRLVIYLDDLLIKGKIEDVLLGRITIIFILQKMGFMIYKDRSCMKSKKAIEFLSFT